MKGRIPLRYQSQNVGMWLADGSRSLRTKGILQMRIAKSVDCKESKLVTFLVVQDGYNLLGRHTVQMLWPKAFNSLVRAIGAKSQ